MDRSEVKAIVDKHIESIMLQLGVPHWDVVVSYGLKGENQGARLKGQCTRQVDYNRAHIEFNPDECDDEEQVLAVLRHEIYHIVLSPFDLYSTAAECHLPDDSPVRVVLGRVWDHAVEKAVINLGRMYCGLVNPEEPPVKKTAPKAAKMTAPTPEPKARPPMGKKAAVAKGMKAGCKGKKGY